MITHRTSDEQHTYNIGKEYYEKEYYEEEYYEEEYYDMENKTIFTYQYPIQIGTSENTAYSCGMYVMCMYVCVCVYYHYVTYLLLLDVPNFRWINWGNK